MSDYGQGAIKLMEILDLNAEEVVGDLMNRLVYDAELSERNIKSLGETIKSQKDEFAYNYGVLQTLMDTVKVQHAAELQAVKDEHKAHLAEIDDVAADAHIEVKCRSCDEYYVLDYEISLFKVDQSYCGRNPVCCP